MRAVNAAGRSFAIDRHGMHSYSPFVYAAPEVPDHDGLFPLLIVADLVESVPWAPKVVEELLQATAADFERASTANPRAAITNAFTLANDRIFAENENRPAGRRLYLGLTCVVLRSCDIFIGQCAPGQVLVWQDETLHAIPALHSWSARDITGTFSSLSYPLGFRRDVQPRIGYSRYADGDVISVISWQLARYVHDNGLLGQDSPSSALPSAVSGIRTGSETLQLHGGVFLIQSGDGHSQKNTAVSGVDVPRVSGESKKADSFHPAERARGKRELAAYWTTGQAVSGSGEASGFDNLDQDEVRFDETQDFPTNQEDTVRNAEDAAFVKLEFSKLQFSGKGTPDQRSHTANAGSEHDYTIAPDPSPHRAPAHARKGYKVEIFAGLLLSLSAAVVGVWQVTKRDRPIHGPRDDGTLGLPHLQRWSDSYQPPRFERVRRASPRFQINGFLLFGAMLAVVALAGVLAFNAVTSRNESQTAGLEERLQSIIAVREQTDTARPSGSSYESLLGAQVALDDLAEAASSDELQERIQDEQGAVATAIEQLASVERLTTVQVMGSLPPVPDGVTPRLFSGGGRVFVHASALFELDQISGTLMQLLTEGDLVGGEPVGKLLASAWNEDRPMAIDSHNVFMMDPADGRWHRAPLGVLSDAGYSNVTAIAVFNRNIYYLTADSGQILKFDALDFAALPEDWSAGVAREQLENAVDLIVDGSIHAALSDGHILSFFRSALDKTIKIDVLPPLQSVSALTTIADGQYMFVVDSGDGRIVGVNREGELYRQFVVAPNVPSLTGASDLVINESNGITYILANETMYLVRLSLPGR